MNHHSAPSLAGPGGFYKTSSAHALNRWFFIPLWEHFLGNIMVHKIDVWNSNTQLKRCIVNGVCHSVNSIVYVCVHACACRWVSPLALALPNKRSVSSSTNSGWALPNKHHSCQTPADQLLWWSVAHKQSLNLNAFLFYCATEEPANSMVSYLTQYQQKTFK